jgi:hypothetical protein
MGYLFVEDLIPVKYATVHFCGRDRILEAVVIDGIFRAAGSDI